MATKFKRHQKPKFSASGEFFFKQIIIRAKNSSAENHPSEELSDEESSGEEFS
jgi:hypothetical protein